MTLVDNETTFSSSQYTEAYPPGVERSFWHVARNAIIARQLAKSAMTQMPLLEIGCGRGIVVNGLRDRGIDCIGCDRAAPRVEPHLAGCVFTGTDFKDLPLEQRNRMRGVLLCDVLEHLPSQGELLREVVRCLPSVTHVLVTVPARMELWSDWDVHYGHFRRYDSHMLAAEIASAGLTLLSSRYFFHALYAPMFAARGRRRSTTITAPRAPLLHRALGNAFIAEGRILPARLPGTSLIAVARV